jgi:Na+/H+-dicarboxylate symporter
MLSYLLSVLYSNLGIFEGAHDIHQTESTLEPLLKVSIPKLLSNNVALLSGVIAGFIGGVLKNNYTAKLSAALNVIAKYFFKILIPIMPLFVIGTAFKLQHDGMLSVICENYLPILIVFVIAGYGMVILQLLLSSEFNLAKLILYVKNIMPAVIVGFGSASSAAALPLSIKGAEDNSTYKKNASVIIPATVNVHLVGDCFFIPMMAIAIMLSFGKEVPSLLQYLPFAVSFVIAKFAVAAVPGGGILVMLPLLQSYLGFSGEMLGLITALYILFDPITTACNVAGNGAMAVMFDKIVSSKRN